MKVLLVSSLLLCLASIASNAQSNAISYVNTSRPVATFATNSATGATQQDEKKHHKHHGKKHHKHHKKS